jgi:hypothetical protein
MEGMIPVERERFEAVKATDLSERQIDLAITHRLEWDR